MMISWSNATSLTLVLKPVEYAFTLLCVCLFIITSSAIAAPLTGSELDPARAQLKEAEMLMSARKWDDAVIAYRSFFVLKAPRQGVNQKDFYEASLGMSRALSYLGRREEALRVLKRLLSTTRDKEKVISRIKVLSGLFLKDETARLYQEGLNHIQFDKHSEAKVRFERALSIEPHNAEVLLRLSQCLVLEDSNKLALEYLLRAKELNPFQPEVRLWLGRALYLNHRVEEALVELTEAKKNIPHSDLVNAWTAAALDRQGKTMTALELLGEDIKDQPSHLVSIVQFAQLQIKNKRVTEKQLISSQLKLEEALRQVERLAEEDVNFHKNIEYRLRFTKPENLKKDIKEISAKIKERLTQIKNDSQENSL